MVAQEIGNDSLICSYAHQPCALVLMESESHMWRFLSRWGLCPRDNWQTFVNWLYLSQAVQPPSVVGMLWTLQVKQEHEFRVAGLLCHDRLLKGAAIHHYIGRHRVNDEAHSRVCRRLDFYVGACEQGGALEHGTF